MSSKISQKNRLALMQLAIQISNNQTPVNGHRHSFKSVKKIYKGLVRLFNKVK